MNSYEKYMMEKDDKEFHQEKVKQDQIYYLQKCLRKKNIDYNSRKKEIYPTSEQTKNKHVQELLKKHNYTVQTIIK